MIQPNNISATSHELDPTTSTANMHKTRQTTLDSNRSDKKTAPRRPQNRNRTLSNFSQRSARSNRSYWKRNHLSWILTPLARRTMQATQIIISNTMPSLINSFSDTDILQEIYR